MSEQTANLQNEHDLDAEYQEATERALHDDAEEQRKRNRQDYSIYVVAAEEGDSANDCD